MRVTAKNVRLVGCRVVEQANGAKVTYGSLYTEDGELLSFSADKELKDSMEPKTYDLLISWGTGKNGKWSRCELV